MIAKESGSTPTGDINSDHNESHLDSHTSSQGERSEAIPQILPILPVRGLVVFPTAVIPIAVERAASLELLDRALAESKILGVLTQRNAEQNDPAPEDLYNVGTVARVLKLIRQSQEGAIVLLQGLQRFVRRRSIPGPPFLRAEIEVLAPIFPPQHEPAWQAIVRNLRDTAIELLELTPNVPAQVKELVSQATNVSELVDFLAVNLPIDVVQKQALLEELNVEKRVHLVQTHIGTQLEIARIQQRLHQDVTSHFSDAQRKAYLREQMQAIRRELGEEGDEDAQMVQLRVRLEEAAPPAEVMAQADRELRRLEFIPKASPEFSVIVSYLETIAELPWNVSTEDQLDLTRAQEILDRDHFDLEKVKRRLIEYLAVRQLNPTGPGPILCFIGPPGVGKTSLGQSIADALGRKFARLSLGGMRDEAEIRGHRRTYIGSMPGRIIQELRRTGSNNPVLMLDEIDKIGADFRGDPASALLEVLDPRQNSTFVDRYLDVPFDLSRIIFIATANYLDPIPPPLLDRMERISIPGYTERQKLEIARRYLIKRQLAENGLKPEQCIWEDAALERTIGDYTHEAGVRELERQVAAVCRGVAAKIARGETSSQVVTPPFIREMLGPAPYIRATQLTAGVPGVVNGLAYTPIGGEVMQIEAARFPGKSGIILTGQLGEVMRESAQAALTLLRTRAEQLKINPIVFAETQIHIHVPAGAVPKDGPSAGIAMFVALASLFMNTAVPSDLAMTGEITLRGLVLPIGGLKEKSLAAMRAGVTRVLIPKLNEKDLPEMPEEVREKVTFLPVGTIDEVLKFALPCESHS